MLHWVSLGMKQIKPEGKLNIQISSWFYKLKEKDMENCNLSCLNETPIT